MNIIINIIKDSHISNYVNIVLVITTIFMALSSYILSKKTLFGKAEILTRGWKMGESSKNIKGSLVTLKEAKKEKLEISKKDNGFIWENALRVCLFLKQGNEYNNIQKIKINSVQLLDINENEVGDEIPNFFKYQKYHTNKKGYESAEYLGYYNNKIEKIEKQATEEHSYELEKEAYRVHIVFKFLNKEQKTKFLNFIIQNEYILKIKLSLINNAKIKATYTLNLANEKFERDASDKEGKFLSNCKHTYIDDLEIKFKHFYN